MLYYRHPIDPQAVIVVAFMGTYCRGTLSSLELFFVCVHCPVDHIVFELFRHCDTVLIRDLTNVYGEFKVI